MSVAPECCRKSWESLPSGKWSPCVCVCMCVVQFACSELYHTLFTCTLLSSDSTLVMYLFGFCPPFNLIFIAIVDWTRSFRQYIVSNVHI